jgi:hypothetical protein
VRSRALSLSSEEKENWELPFPARYFCIKRRSKKKKTTARKEQIGSSANSLQTVDFNVCNVQVAFLRLRLRSAPSPLLFCRCFLRACPLSFSSASPSYEFRDYALAIARADIRHGDGNIIPVVSLLIVLCDLDSFFLDRMLHNHRMVSLNRGRKVSLWK